MSFDHRGENEGFSLGCDTHVQRITNLVIPLTLVLQLLRQELDYCKKRRIRYYLVFLHWRQLNPYADYRL